MTLSFVLYIFDIFGILCKKPQKRSDFADVGGSVGMEHTDSEELRRALKTYGTFYTSESLPSHVATQCRIEEAG